MPTGQACSSRGEEQERGAEGRPQGLRLILCAPVSLQELREASALWNEADRTWPVYQQQVEQTRAERAAWEGWSAGEDQPPLQVLSGIDPADKSRRPLSQGASSAGLRGWEQDGQRWEGWSAGEDQPPLQVLSGIDPADKSRRPLSQGASSAGLRGWEQDGQRAARQGLACSSPGGELGISPAGRRVAGSRGLAGPSLLLARAYSRALDRGPVGNSPVLPAVLLTGISPAGRRVAGSRGLAGPSLLLARAYSRALDRGPVGNSPVLPAVLLTLSPLWQRFASASVWAPRPPAQPRGQQVRRRWRKDVDPLPGSKMGTATKLALHAE